MNVILPFVGKILTALGILSLLQANIQAWITSGGTWTLLATAAILWLAFELHRDAGLGQLWFQQAKEANARAWAFEPEFRARMDAIAEETQQFHKLAEKVIADHETLRVDLEQFKFDLANIRNSFTNDVHQIANQLLPHRIDRAVVELTQRIDQQVIESWNNDGHRVYKTLEFFQRQIRVEIAEINAKIAALQSSAASP